MNHDTAKIIANLIDPEQLPAIYIKSALVTFYDGSKGVIKEPLNIRDLKDGHPRFNMVANVEWLVDRVFLELHLKMIVQGILRSALGNAENETGGE